MFISSGPVKITTISVELYTALSSPFPTSKAQFQEPPGITLFGPLLQFLQDTDSCFLINLYPLNPEIPLGIAVFQEYPFNFCNDFITGVRYETLSESERLREGFDMRNWEEGENGRRGELSVGGEYVLTAFKLLHELLDDGRDDQAICLNSTSLIPLSSLPI
ncbi:uncharacterized protein HKW66_Vig0244400 [Vigna angularis]|uniref:Uncharacterized protein n=1 Tax=Phaseolus angularis TaxID=3914 RepID=A0A8T0L315_PHAAN|nr:uncharacterized protein HKW66_Vig0244400 [Vigna angularis]